MKLEGVFCAVVTPFRNGELDLDSFERILEFLKERVDGVVICGTTGEFPSLSYEEKKSLIKDGLKEETNGFKVIPQIGGTNLGESLKLGEIAKKEGACVLMAVTPFYYEWSFRSIRRYYEKLDGIDLPLVIYDIPKYTGVTLTYEEMEELCDKFRIVGLKETTTEEERLKELSNLSKRISLLVGTDSLIDFGLRTGYRGCVSAISNFLPEAVTRIYEHARKGEWEDASNLQSKLNRVRSILKKGPSIRNIKKALELRGLRAGEVRGPFPNFEPKSGERFLRRLEATLKEEDLQWTL